MANILTQIGKKNAVDVTTGFAKIAVASIGSAVATKTLKISVDSYLNVLNNVRNSIRNS
ncbi:hypothetical protein DesyoDRAFT_5411 [Desulfosporosinus youngiae DSM 17734]|uniref:Uncharacterized protein n=1 Tax=Desulfosporosinus youngiae DSM 17734 TaxID=768710 RepID=H5Y0S9_9FIRM|nr:hypothetical protein DesyoDRAFT_5411 [Desulfosporosinus youngiae DSM 17734]